jgi:hypothetical protein
MKCPRCGGNLERNNLDRYQAILCCMGDRGWGDLEYGCGYWYPCDQDGNPCERPKLDTGGESE